MKPNLILGLGNPLMGDDGVGWRVAETLAHDPQWAVRVPPDTEVLCAGTDLLRWTDEMEGRGRVLLIDALLGNCGLDDERTGDVEVFEEPFPETATRQWNVHHLSPPQAIRLLQLALPALRKVRFTILAVAIESVEIRPELSPGLNARLPDILEFVLRRLEFAPCGYQT